MAPPWRIDNVYIDVYAIVETIHNDNDNDNDLFYYSDLCYNDFVTSNLN